MQLLRGMTNSGPYDISMLYCDSQSTISFAKNAIVHQRQACSQACLSGVAKLYPKNHVVHNMRAYFIFYAITIKWIMCVQEKIELSSMSQRPRIS